VAGRNPSADLLREWAERDNFVWLVTEDILDEYKEVLKRLGASSSHRDGHQPDPRKG